MKNMKLILTILTVLAFISCENKQTFNIEFDDANGLRENSKVVFRGQTIGEIDKIGFNNNRKIIVDLLIDKDFVMPDNYKFVIVSLDLFGSKAIELRDLDKSGANSSGEIIKGEIESSNVLDSLPDKFINIIENAATNQTNKQDSILIELRRLNKNLEDLKEKN